MLVLIWMFQYILCCCLTPSAIIVAPTSFRFQYILCCCLTIAAGTTLISSGVFQYILCCCLTQDCSMCVSKTMVSIHLMLLFNTLIDKVLAIIACFNTSYVVVSLGGWPSGIHTDLFQYILCCCLTQFEPVKTYHSWVSIHLMLLFNTLDQKY